MALNRLARLSIDIVVNAQRANRQIKDVEQNLKKVKTTAAGGGIFGRAGAVGLGVMAGVAAFRILNTAIRTTIHLLVSTTQAFAKFERQLIDVGKIAGVSDLNKINTMFRNLRLEVRGFSMEEMSKTASAAARAGFSDLAEIEELTKIALRFQAASGDISGEEAALGLARLGKNLELTLPELAALAATIDILSDKFSVTAGQILTTTQRLSGFAEAAGISGEKMAAFSAALLASGQTPTVVRSSTIQLIQQLAKDAVGAGKALGMTQQEAEDFAVVFRTDVIEGLREFTVASEKLSLVELTKAFDKIGLATARTSSTLAILSKGLEQFDEAQKIGGQDNLATHLEKADVVARSAAAQLVETTNRWEEFKTSVAQSEATIHMLNTVLTLLEKIGDATGFRDPKGAIFDAKEDGPPRTIADVKKELDDARKSLEEQKKVAASFDNIFSKSVKHWTDTHRGAWGDASWRIGREALKGSGGDPMQWAASKILQAAMFATDEIGLASEEQKVKAAQAEVAKLTKQMDELVAEQERLNAEQGVTDEERHEIAQKRRADLRKRMEEARKIVEAEQLAERDELKEKLLAGAFTLPRKLGETLEQERTRVLASLEAEKNEIIRIMSEAGAFGIEFGPIDKKFEEMKKRIEENIDFQIKERDEREKNRKALEAERIERQKLQKHLSGLGGFTGTIGQLVGILQQRQAALGPGGNTPQFMNALNALASDQINNLFRGGRGRTHGFSGLTDAWKQAQEKTDEKNPLLKEQLIVAKKLLEAMGDQGIIAQQLVHIWNELKGGKVVEIQ